MGAGSTVDHHPTPASLSCPLLDTLAIQDLEPQGTTSTRPPLPLPQGDWSMPPSAPWGTMPTPPLTALRRAIV